MVRRVIGQEDMFGAERRVPTDLDELAVLIDWDATDALMSGISSSSKGEQGWPPLCLFKAMVLGCWYDLSDVKLAEALDDRASFRRFCGFSRNEPTPERTAFVRFRKTLVELQLSNALFDTLTKQLKTRHITVKTGTLIDATIIASASKKDGQAKWVKHKNRKAVHGYKAHVAADEGSDLIEKIGVTPANVNDGKAGCAIVPDDPGLTYADSAYRGPRFSAAVEQKGGTACVVITHVWAKSQEEARIKLRQINQPIHKVRGKIEKIFGTCKRSYGLTRMNCLGLAKAELQVALTAMAYNLKRGLSLERAKTA